MPVCSNEMLGTEIAMTDWKEVSEDEFYAVIGPQNVHPRIVNGSYPYTSVFMTPSGQEKGKAIGGEPGTERKYMLPNVK